MTEEPGWQIESLFHFTVNASNFDRSLEFYTTIGFVVLRNNRDVVWPDFLAAQFGMKKAQGRGALLGIGDGPDHTRLDLLEWLEPRYPDPAKAIPLEERIPRIIALRTRNVRAAYDDLRAKGIEFIGEPRDPDPKIGVEAVVCCRDPDDVVIEFIEYMPGVLGSRIDSLETR